MPTPTVSTRPQNLSLHRPPLLHDWQVAKLSSGELSAYILANGGQYAAMMSEFMQQYGVTGEDFVSLSTDSLDSLAEGHVQIIEDLSLLQGKQIRTSPKTQRIPHISDIFPELSDSFHAAQSPSSTFHTALHNTGDPLHLSEALEQDNSSRGDSLARRELDPTHDTSDCSPASQNRPEVVASSDVDSPIPLSATNPRSTADEISQIEASSGSIPTTTTESQAHSSSTTELSTEHFQRDGSGFVNISTAPAEVFDALEQIISTSGLILGQRSLDSRSCTPREDVDVPSNISHPPDDTILDDCEKNSPKTKQVHDLAVSFNEPSPSLEDTDDTSLLSLSRVSQRTLEGRNENLKLYQYSNGQSSAGSAGILFSVVDPIHQDLTVNRLNEEPLSIASSLADLPSLSTTGTYISDETTDNILSSRRDHDIESLVTLSPPVSLVHQLLSETVASQFALNDNNGTPVELLGSSLIPGGRRAETGFEPSSVTSGTEVGSIFTTNGSVTLIHPMVASIHGDDHGSENADSHALLSQASTSTLDPLDPPRLTTSHIPPFSTTSKMSGIGAENDISSPEIQSPCICSQVKHESVESGQGEMHALVASSSLSNLNEARRPIPSPDAYHVDDSTRDFLSAFDVERSPTLQCEECSALSSKDSSTSRFTSITDPAQGGIMPGVVIHTLTLPRFGSLAEELSPLFFPQSHGNIPNAGSVEKPIHVSHRSPYPDDRTLWLPTDSRRNGQCTVLTTSKQPSKSWRPAAVVQSGSDTVSRFADISDFPKERRRSFVHASVQTDAEHLRTRNRYLEEELKKVRRHHHDPGYRSKHFWSGLGDLLFRPTTTASTAINPRLGTLMPSDSIDSSANSFGLPVV